MTDLESAFEQHRRWAARAMLASPPRIVMRREDDEPPDDDEPREPVEPEGDEPEGGLEPAEDEGPDAREELPVDLEDDAVERSEWFTSLDPSAQRAIATLRKEAADRRGALRQYEELGALEELRDRLADETDDPNAAMRRFFEAGQRLGLGSRDLSQLLMGEGPLYAQPPQPTRKQQRALDADEEPWGDEEPDERDPRSRPVTMADLEEWDQRNRAQQAVEARGQFIVGVIDGALNDLGVPDDEDVRELVVDRFARRHLPDGIYDPTSIRNAIKRGWGDYTKAISKVLDGLQPTEPDGGEPGGQDDERLRRKATSAARSPSSLKGGRGGVPGARAPAEPESYEDGKARARERLRREGLLR